MTGTLQEFICICLAFGVGYAVGVGNTLLSGASTVQVVIKDKGEG